MTDRELKRLSRAELLELLLEEGQENERLRAQLDKANQAINDKSIAIGKAGSIAEAALALSGVFDAAQQAAQQYLENIQRLSGDQQAVCQRMEDEAQRKADQIMAETLSRCRQLEADTRAKCDDLTRAAQQKSAAYWDDVKRQVEAFCAQRDALRELISPAGRDKA